MEILKFPIFETRKSWQWEKSLASLYKRTRMAGSPPPFYFLFFNLF
jgi:hypothetical protein